MPIDIHDKHYHQHHRSQFDRGCSPQTRREGCTWTTGANGIAACTGGKKRPTPDTVLRKVANREQTSPMVPGWSLTDLELACKRLGVVFENHTGDGWDALRDFRNRGFYIACQGDSDVFSSGCMSKFDGDHCIGIHPDENADNRWRLDDPLCPEASHRDASKIREYAQKVDPNIRFGIFRPVVPLA